MGKSIIELFKSEQISFKDSGTVETAQKHFAIRNSKDIDNEPSNPLLIPSFKLQKVIRKKLSIRDRETRFEEEVTGLNALMLLSGPALYGTDLFRLKRKTTNMLDDMRAASNGSNTNGLLGGFVKKVEKFGKDLLGKLGITFPEKLIPTRVVQNQIFKDGLENDLIKTLKTLKDGSAGSAVGRFLADNTKGGLSGVPNRLLSSGITAAKNTLGKLLFGSRMEAGQALAKSGGKYNSKALYSKTLDYTNTNIGDRNDLSTIMLFSSIGANLNVPASLKKVPPKGKSYNPPIVNALATYTNTFSVINGTEYTKVKKKNTIHSTRGFGLGLKGDLFNKLGVATANSKGQVLFPLTNQPIDDLDFIPFKFIGLASGNHIYFRATLTSLSETFSPNWESKNFAGNPIPFYSYGHIERAITLNFKVFSESAFEHSRMWTRLAELGRLVYPQNYSGRAGKATAPFIKMTIGDMYKDKLGFIESLTFNAPDNTPWEIGMNTDGLSGLSRISTDSYKAPMIIEVELTYKFLIGPQNIQESTLYDFGSCKPTATPPPPTPPPPVPPKRIPSIPITTTPRSIPSIGKVPIKVPVFPPPTPPTPPAPVPDSGPPVPVPPIPPTPPTGGGGKLGGAPTETSVGSDIDNTGGLPETNIVTPTPPTPPVPPTSEPAENPPPPQPDYTDISEFYIVWDVEDIRKLPQLTVPIEEVATYTIKNKPGDYNNFAAAGITRYFPTYAAFEEGMKEAGNQIRRELGGFMGATDGKLGRFTTIKGAGSNPWSAVARLYFMASAVLYSYTGPLYQNGKRIR